MNEFLIIICILLIIFSWFIRDMICLYKGNSDCPIFIKNISPGLDSHNKWRLYKEYFYPHFDGFKFKLYKIDEGPEIEDWQARNLCMGRDLFDEQGFKEIRQIKYERDEYIREHSYDYTNRGYPFGIW